MQTEERNASHPLRRLFVACVIGLAGLVIGSIAVLFTHGLIASALYGLLGWFGDVVAAVATAVLAWLVIRRVLWGFQRDFAVGFGIGAAPSLLFALALTGGGL